VIRTRSACVPHGNPTGLPHLALSVPEGSLPLLPPLRLLRQSLIDHLRDTVQNPYLLHPHSLTKIKIVELARSSVIVIYLIIYLIIFYYIFNLANSILLNR
jgi:hypothetical protein